MMRKKASGHMSSLSEGFQLPDWQWQGTACLCWRLQLGFIAALSPRFSGQGAGLQLPPWPGLELAGGSCTVVQWGFRSRSSRTAWAQLSATHGF